MSLLRHSNSPCRWLLIVLLAMTLGSLHSTVSAEPRRDKGSQEERPRARIRHRGSLS